MELFGIVLSIPAGFVCTVVYAWLLNRFLWSRKSLRHAMRVASVVALGLIVVEVIVLGSMGAVRARETLGPVFYVIHTILFFAAVPSLANVMLLKRTKPKWTYVLMVACACATFAMPVVLMQYGVSEALYGVNGDDGPFSSPEPADRLPAAMP